MGGPFSGRWGWGYRRKTRVDECRSFTVAHLVGDKPPAAGYAGRFEWRSRDGTAVLASIRFTFVTASRVRLDYLWGEAAEPVAVPFDLVALPTPKGGTRYLAVCPLVVNDTPCRRRTAKLYLPPGGKYFGCRTCHRLSYRSRQGHDKRVTALLKSGKLPELAANPAGLPVQTLGLILSAITEHDRRLERAPPPVRAETEGPPEEVAVTDPLDDLAPDDLTGLGPEFDDEAEPGDPPPESLLIDIRVLSALLDRSVAALERDATAGRLPKAVRLGGSRKWVRAEIQDWVAAGCPPQAEWEELRRE